MANRTVKDARNIHGTNPQYLIEKIIRSRIYDSKFWKEQCFALTAELLVDKAMEIRFIGGVYGGNIRPTPFLCLTLKMLQIQPEKDIVVEFIKNEEFKYVRALGAFYLRLTGSSLDCYKYLEPLYNDNRKLRHQNRQGQYEILHIDEYIDELLRSDRVCDIILPRIQKRHILEENNELEPKISALDDDLDEDMPSDDELIAKRDINKKKNRKGRERSRSKEKDVRDRRRAERERLDDELKNRLRMETELKIKRYREVERINSERLERDRERDVRERERKRKLRYSQQFDNKKDNHDKGRDRDRSRRRH